MTSSSDSTSSTRMKGSRCGMMASMSCLSIIMSVPPIRISGWPNSTRCPFSARFREPCHPGVAVDFIHQFHRFDDAQRSIRFRQSNRPGQMDRCPVMAMHKRCRRPATYQLAGVLSRSRCSRRFRPLSAATLGAGPRNALCRQLDVRPCCLYRHPNTAGLRLFIRRQTGIARSALRIPARLKPVCASFYPSILLISWICMIIPPFFSGKRCRCVRQSQANWTGQPGPASLRLSGHIIKVAFRIRLHAGRWSAESGHPAWPGPWRSLRRRRRRPADGRSSTWSS